MRGSFGHAALAGAIAQLLCSQHCYDEGVKLVRLQDLSMAEAEPFHAAAELAVQSVLHPDLERTAVMAAAALIAQGSYGDNELDVVNDLSRETQAHYVNLAQVVIRGYRQTLRLQSPDPQLDAEYCRLIDALEQRGLVRR